MARATIPVTTSTTKGVVWAAEQNGDAVEGHVLANSGRERLFVRNASVDTGYDVTIRFNKTVDGQAVTSYVEEVAFGTTQVFGPFDTENYGTSVLIDVENANLKLRAVA